MLNSNVIEAKDLYSFDAVNKEDYLISQLSNITKYHIANCTEYKKMVMALGFDENKEITQLSDFPFIPVSLFKKLDLKSIPTSKVFKTLLSSGTTGQARSKIYLSKENAIAQQKSLINTISAFTSIKRSPMLIIDSETVLKDRKSFSARGAGILGFSLFGTQRCFALNENLKLDFERINEFLQKHNGKPIFVFGFTYLIWEYFVKALVGIKNKPDLSNATLIHGGGWKKLQNKSVTNAVFKEDLNSVCGITKIHDYYGMIEQTGNIYMQCEDNYLHPSLYGDVIIRNPLDFSVCDVGQKGIIQSISTLAHSYCGHSVLTEDVGVLDGIDTCKCGRKGKYFRVLGRIKRAEIRGCSDTYET